MKLKKRMLIIAISILTGLIIPHLKIFLFVVIFFMILAIPCIPFRILSIIYKLISKTDLSKIGASLLAIEFPIILFVSSVFISEATFEKYNRARVEALILKLEHYKTENQRYPDKLEEIQKQDNFFKIDYLYIHNSENYRIRFDRNGFVVVEYDNETKKWQNYGWND